MSKKVSNKRAKKSIIHRPVFREYTDEDGEVIKTIGREQQSITATFFQVHDDIFELYGKLNFLSLCLLQYFGRQMGDDSCIHFNRFEKNKFISFFVKNGGRRYGLGSIDNALQSLKKAEAIRALGNATFYVNARYITRYINNDERKKRVTLDEEWKFKRQHGIKIWTNWLQDHLENTSNTNA